MTLYDYIFKNIKLEELDDETLTVNGALSKKKLIALIKKERSLGRKIPNGFFRATGDDAAPI